MSAPHPTADVVVGIDSSTTATKAVAWDAAGGCLAQGRHAIPLANPGPGRYEQDSRDWWTSTCAALGAVLREVAPERVAAVAIANQRETFVPVRADGTPVRPAMVWLDERSGEEIRALSRQLGAERINEITGRYPDLTPVLYRLAWMQRHEPGPYREAALFLEVHSCLVHRLTGQFKTSFASADPLGVFDVRRLAWSEEILAAVGLTPDRFPPAFAPGTVLGEVTPAAAAATGLRAGTPVVAGGGDGQCCGLGANVTRPGTAYLNLGTAVVSGLYSPDYRIGPAFRTLVPVSGPGYLLETVLRSGTFLLTWFREQFCGGDDRASFQKLEERAAAVPPGSDGLLVVPHWSGSMTPHWNHEARGLMFGFHGGHTQAHVYRAILEGLAYELRLMHGRAESAAGQSADHLVVIGGGAQSPLWSRIVADVTGKPLRSTQTTEATNLGAAALAAVGAGWYPDPVAAAASMARSLPGATPGPAGQAVYQNFFALYQELYPRLSDLYAPLARACQPAAAAAGAPR